MLLGADNHTFKFCTDAMLLRKSFREVLLVCRLRRTMMALWKILDTHEHMMTYSVEDNRKVNAECGLYRTNQSKPCHLMRAIFPVCRLKLKAPHQ